MMIIDSSAVFRQTLSKVLSADPGIKVIATASDPYIAAGKMSVQVPDVITLDVEMPRMNGITFLRKIMAQYPMPVVIISDLAENNKQLTVKALEYGAVEVMAKNMFNTDEISAIDRAKICTVIKEAARVTPVKKTQSVRPVAPKLSSDVVLHHVRPKNLIHTNDKVIAVGASTGGIKAISVFLEALPVDVPGILIVQHLPKKFTKSFAERLNEVCSIAVKEAEDGDIVKPGRALVAPGNRHMLLIKRGRQYYVEVRDGPLVNRHRPSVDVLFRSAALYAGKNGIGILLTGMGDDGSRGLLEMREAGAKTIAQDERSSVVFGMPREAILLNAADEVLPLNDIARHVLAHLTR